MTRVQSAMDGSEYRALRETIGTQAEAAERLGVARNTIARRERGELSISREVEYAMRWVARRQRFTMEDVESLRAIANVTLDRDPTEPHANPVAAERHRSIADRIEALLPPAGD